MESASIHEPGIFGRFCRWLAGYSREESTREAELRLTLADREKAIADLREDKAALESALRVRELECRMMADVVERDRRRVQAETMAAGYFAGVASGAREAGR